MQLKTKQISTLNRRLLKYIIETGKKSGMTLRKALIIRQRTKDNLTNILELRLQIIGKRRCSFFLKRQKSNYIDYIDIKLEGYSTQTYLSQGLVNHPSNRTTKSMRTTKKYTIDF